MLQLGSKPQQWFTTVSEFPQFSVFRWLNNRILIYGKGIEERKKAHTVFYPAKNSWNNPPNFHAAAEIKIANEPSQTLNYEFIDRKISMGNVILVVFRSDSGV